MTSIPTIEQLRRAAASVTVTFDGVPADPVRVPSAAAMTRTDAARVVERYDRHGYAVVRLDEGPWDQAALLVLTRALDLGDPFVPPLYASRGVASSVSTIAASETPGGVGHPHFETRVGQDLHCDGTLQDIGYVKASVLLCESPAVTGGETTLFNASAAYAALVAADPAAAVALATPGVLVRQATMEGATDVRTGPAFTVRDGALVARYCVDVTDSWAVPSGVDEADVSRGVEFLRRAAAAPSPYYRELTLDAGEAIVFDNVRISHGRTPYQDGPGRVRCLYRSLHLRHPSAGGTA